LLTPSENLDWYARMDGQPNGIEEALSRVGLDPRIQSPCSQLSQGQQRRVSLARLLICQRPLWLLDEPFTALDVDGQRVVREIVAEHCSAGGAAVCATHQALGWQDATTLKLG
jgi:heme exporter protein A